MQLYKTGEESKDMEVPHYDPLKDGFYKDETSARLILGHSVHWIVKFVLK